MHERARAHARVARAQLHLQAGAHPLMLNACYMRVRWSIIRSTYACQTRSCDFAAAARTGTCGSSPSQAVLDEPLEPSVG